MTFYLSCFFKYNYDNNMYVLQETLTMYVSCQRHHKAALYVTEICLDGGTIGKQIGANILSTVDAMETKTTLRQECTRRCKRGITSRLNKYKTKRIYKLRITFSRHYISNEMRLLYFKSD